MNNKLTIDRILDFCDVPQLFIARDAFDTIYLCLLYEDEPSCQYTAIRISNNRLQEFLGGEKDLRELFDNPETAFEYFDVEYRDDTIISSLIRLHLLEKSAFHFLATRCQVMNMRPLLFAFLLRIVVF
jgi:hypothetical protein